MRSTRVAARVAAALTVAALVAGCGGAPGDGGDESSSTGDGSHDRIPPSELVGLWRVDAAGESDDTWLQIASSSSSNDLTLWRDCGVISGSWIAGNGAMLTSLTSWSGACGTVVPEVDWLLDARAFAADGDARVLLDASGELVARLTIDGEPPPNPDVADRFREQPTLSAEQIAELDDLPTAPPQGVQPAAVEDLLGRWVPTTTYETEPFLELADGIWTGSDGCNGLGGRWMLDEVGATLATSGPQTAMLCEGESLGSLLVESTWLVVVGDSLTFYDGDGAVLGEAVRG